MMKIRIDDIVASDNLPSLPEVANRVLTLARDSKTDVAELAAAVKADPAMCAKVLRTANSAYFGRQFKVNSVQAAIPVLGSTLLRTLVLGFWLTRQEKWHRCKAAYRNIWQRTIYQAVAAQQLAEQLPAADSDFYFACGLVQDVGSLALLSALADEYSEGVLSSCDMQGLAAAEQSNFGFSHIEVGVRLCQKWQLAPEAIAAVQAHHEPLCVLNSQRHTTSTLAEALKLASYCANYIETDSGHYDGTFLVSLSKVFHIDGNQIEEFFRQLRQRANELAMQFDRGPDSLPDPDEIIRKAKAAIEIVAIQRHLEVSEAIQQNSHLQEEVQRDPLTGVGNRRALERALDETIRCAIDQEESLGILFFDIDHFKPLNDTLGHEAGDKALKIFVAVLRRSLRKRDIIVRYGGDEFIAICIGPSLGDMNAIAERICEDFADAVSTGPNEAPLTTSVGGIQCPFEVLAELDLSAAISEADQNMYRSKKLGGNRWSIRTLVDARATR